eukprot:m.18822 g.18822  ORF g.18822 m.18822 type:complete len:60 (+) comp5017_c0_seq3:201-380(+)
MEEQKALSVLNQLVQKCVSWILYYTDVAVLKGGDCLHFISLFTLIFNLQFHQTQEVKKC